MNTTLTDKDLKLELELSERRRLALKRRMIMENLEAEDNGLWTMLDLITLILVFFIILYTPRVQDTTPLPKPRVQKPPAQVFVDDTAADRPGMQMMARDLRSAMAGLDLGDYNIRLEKDRIRLSIGEAISFSSGRAALLSPVKPALIRLADFLNTRPEFRIVVAGHTDNTPIYTREFPSNWELSTARAMSVAKFLMAFEVAPERMSVQGFGEFRPVAENNASEGRLANRRVEISLLLNDPA